MGCGAIPAYLSINFCAAAAATLRLLLCRCRAVQILLCKLQIPADGEMLRTDFFTLAALHAAFRLFFVLQIILPFIFYMVVGSVNVVFVPQCEVLRNVYASRARHTIPTAGTAILYSALQI